jgi:thiamine monophosphate kinase
MVRRGGALAGDRLMVSGHVGDGWLGLRAARGDLADRTAISKAATACRSRAWTCAARSWTTPTPPPTFPTA